MNTLDLSNSMYVQNQLNNDVQTTSPLERVAADLALTKSADDPAYLAISETLKLNESGLSQSIKNVTSAMQALDLGDSALGSQSDILNQVRDLVIESSTDTTNDDQRAIIKDEINKLLENLNNIASSTNYNGETLLQKDFTDNSSSDGLSIQTGNDESISTDEIQSNTTGLNLNALYDESIITSENGADYLKAIDLAIEQIDSYRSDLGSVSSQLESSFTNLSSQVVNNISAESVISNIDYASEVNDFSKQNILAQVGAFGQAQANNITQQSVLKLLL